MIFSSAKVCQQLWLFMCGCWGDEGVSCHAHLPLYRHKKYLSQPEETYVHVAGTVAITWKSGRACPQEELSSGEAWEEVKVPRMDAVAFLAFCTSNFFSATVHWWQHKMGVVMRSIDDRDGDRQSLAFASAAIGKHFPHFYSDDSTGKIKLFLNIHFYLSKKMVKSYETQIKKNII